MTQIIDLAPSEMSSNFRSFFSDFCSSSSSFAPDVTHDVVVKVGQKEFFAHKFILASRCDYFRCGMGSGQSCIDGYDPDHP